MKPRITNALAALLVAGAVPVAFAQTPPEAQFGPLPPAAPANNLVDLASAPIASASRTDGIAANIVDALVADPVMAGTKVSVQPTEEGITLTGTTRTRAQVKRAGEIALQFAGEGRVVNAITTEEI